MKERDATNGTKLLALIISFQMRVSFKTSLGYFEEGEQASECWNEAACDMHRNLVEAIG